MAKRTRNRMELRDQFEAAERIKKDDDEVEDEEEETDEEADADDEEDGEEAEEDGDAVAEAEVEIDPDAEEEEEVKPVKKKRKKAAPKEPKPKRVRASKITRMRVVWGVFNNSNQRVATYPYPQKKEADEHAARLKAESKSNQTHFVQPIKEPIEEPK